jgi:4-amino-4-deoxy-L-arabinose transferase-like glycosyltransferase
MPGPIFTLLSFAVVAALALLAIRLNRDDRRPAASAALLILAAAVFAWASLVWLVRP